MKFRSGPNGMAKGGPERVAKRTAVTVICVNCSRLLCAIRSWELGVRSTAHGSRWWPRCPESCPSAWRAGARRRSWWCSCGGRLVETFIAQAAISGLFQVRPRLGPANILLALYLVSIRVPLRRGARGYAQHRWTLALLHAGTTSLRSLNHDIRLGPAHSRPLMNIGHPSPSIRCFEY